MHGLLFTAAIPMTLSILENHSPTCIAICKSVKMGLFMQLFTS